MNSWKIKAVLIVSLAFNLAVLGMVVTAWSLHRPDREETVGQAASHEEFFRERSRCIAEGIGLCEKKTMALEREMVRSCGEEDKVKLELYEARAELLDLLHEARPDSGAVIRKLESISVLQSELERMLVVKIMRSQAVLDPVEKVRFLKLIGCCRVNGRKGHAGPCPMADSLGKDEE